VNPVEIAVNGRKVSASTEPRTHLADFLRDTLNLTGTHLGCEHGVCGACTLLLDDMPVRSCITYAAACDGSRVTTMLVRPGSGRRSDSKVLRPITTGLFKVIAFKRC